MKKTLLAVLFIMICITSACTRDKSSGFQNIESDRVIDKIANKDTFLLIIEHSGSYACEIFKNEIKSTVDKNKLLVYVLDESDMDASIKDQLNIAIGDYSSWPTMFYIKDGSLIITDKYEYSKDPEGWMTWMENMKLIKKDN